MEVQVSAPDSVYKYFDRKVIPWEYCSYHTNQYHPAPHPSIWPGHVSWEGPGRDQGGPGGDPTTLLYGLLAFCVPCVLRWSSITRKYQTICLKDPLCCIDCLFFVTKGLHYRNTIERMHHTFPFMDPTLLYWLLAHVTWRLSVKRTAHCIESGFSNTSLVL